KSAPMDGLRGGITSVLTAGAMRFGKNKHALQGMVEEAGKGGKVNIRQNFKKVFGGNSERIIATFVEWPVTKVGEGKVDLDAVPAELLEGFLQEVNETSIETHTGTAHEGSRADRVERELRKNENKLTEAERNDFRQMHQQASATDPYITVAEYVRVRNDMAADAVFAWSQRNPGKTLTEAQIKAYIMWCREAVDAETFQQRIHTDPDLVDVVRNVETEVKTETDAGKTAAGDRDFG